MLDRLDACNVFPQLAHLARVAELLGGQLHPHGKLGLAQIKQFLAQILIVFLSQFGRFHCLPQMTRNKGGRNRQLRSSQGERFTGQCLVHAIHFI